MKTKHTVTFIIIFIVFVLFWQYAEYVVNIGRLNSGLTSLEAFLPTPFTIFKTITGNFGLLVTELGYTLFRGIFGLIVGTIFSLIMTVLIILFPKSRNIFMPMTISLNSFPMVGFAPVIILIFGQGSVLGIIFISALISYFPTFVILDKAAREVNEEFVNLAKIWGANRWNIFTQIQLPYILPYLFTSFKLSLPASIIGATLGEWLGTKNGIGQLITVSLYQLKPGILYSSLILIVVSVSFLVGVISMLEKLAIPWRNETNQNI